VCYLVLVVTTSVVGGTSVLGRTSLLPPTCSAATYSTSSLASYLLLSLLTVLVSRSKSVW
jgi:hypothetical protein